MVQHGFHEHTSVHARVQHYYPYRTERTVRLSDIKGTVSGL